MTGKHEPPARSSFWVSVAMSTLKFGVLVAAVVVGVVVLVKAFEGPTTPAAPGPVVTDTETKAPKPKKSPKPVKEKEPKSPAPEQGVRVGVFNASTQDGLAAGWEAKLTDKGYVSQQLGSATETARTTTLYYRKAPDQAAAEQLESSYFNGATIEALPNDLEVSVEGQTVKVDKGVQVAIILGADQAK